MATPLPLSRVAAVWLWLNRGDMAPPAAAHTSVDICSSGMVAKVDACRTEMAVGHRSVPRRACDRASDWAGCTLLVYVLCSDAPKTPHGACVAGARLRTHAAQSSMAPIHWYSDAHHAQERVALMALSQPMARVDHTCARQGRPAHLKEAWQRMPTVAISESRRGPGQQLWKAPVIEPFAHRAKQACCRSAHTAINYWYDRE